MRKRLFTLIVAVAVATLVVQAQQLGAPGVPAEPPGLIPTNHPPIPRELSQAWLVPASASARPAVLSEFTTAVRLVGLESFSRALPILAQPGLQSGSVGLYSRYYKGIAELRLNRVNDARRTFRALQQEDLSGFLREAATLREAECDEELENYASALAIYEQLAQTGSSAPDVVLMRLGRAAVALGDVEKARAAFARIYYEMPMSDQSLAAGAELDKLPNVEPLAPGNARFAMELKRSELLFSARQYAPARSAFQALRSVAREDDLELVTLRIAECDHYLKNNRVARDSIRPLTTSGSRQSEALYFHALIQRALRNETEYLKTLRRIATDFPNDSWAEDALNGLATAYIVDDEDANADATLREMYERFPRGKYAERAAWKIGWKAYREGRYADTIQYFDRAPTDFPRSDYRPMWLYWAGRAHDALKQPGSAEAHYRIAVADYLNSYYGRLAAARLTERGLQASAPARAGALERSTPSDRDVAPPPNTPMIQELLGLGLFDQATDELRYAQKVWGDTPLLQATLSWISQQQSRSESGSQQFTLLRGSINTMRRAYPQFMAAGGETLPREVLTTIFPIAFWDLIQKHADKRDLDPYLVAALVAQESTFVPDIRSQARAVGLMQLLPSTARQYARRLSLRYSTRLLTNPDANVQMGTAYLADKIKEFGEVHLALASYNAGEVAVRRWKADRPGVPRDEFIDDIPYPETQNYVKRILGTAEDYRRLYGSDAAPTAPKIAAAETSPAPPAVKAAAPTQSAKRAKLATSSRSTARKPRKTS